MKADPFAFAAELRPKTASVTTAPPQHVWKDADIQAAAHDVAAGIPVVEVADDRDTLGIGRPDGEVEYHARGHGAEWWITDPYSFGPVLGPLDDFLMGEGRDEDFPDADIQAAAHDVAAGIPVVEVADDRDTLGIDEGRPLRLRRRASPQDRLGDDRAAPACLEGCPPPHRGSAGRPARPS
jgi:hypothetical protein